MLAHLIHILSFFFNPEPIFCASKPEKKGAHDPSSCTLLTHLCSYFIYFSRVVCELFHTSALLPLLSLPTTCIDWRISQHLPPAQLNKSFCRSMPPCKAPCISEQTQLLHLSFIRVCSQGKGSSGLRLFTCLLFVFKKAQFGVWVKLFVYIFLFR